MQSRRSFIAASASAAGAATLSVAGSPPAGAATESAPYDLAAIDATLRLPFAHRQAFGTRRLADGEIADYMLNALNAYEFDYGDGPGTLHALGIFYGTSVAMLVDDDVWRRYNIATVMQRRGDPASSTRSDANPYLRATSALDPAAPRSDVHGLYHDSSLTALARRKASFFACDNALRGLATAIAVTYATSDAPLQTVHADLRKHLVPAALLVPAGVAAVNQAQEMKFTFFPASV